MPRRTRAEAEQTRQNLLKTALALFSDTGISQTSLKQISLAAGVTHGALYWHFRNRQHLLEELHQQHLLPLEQHYLEQRQAAVQDALSALEDFLLATLDDIEQHDEVRQYYRVFYYDQQGMSDSDLLAQRLAEDQQSWLEKIHFFLKQARKQKQIALKKSKLDSAAQALFSVFQGQVSSWLRAGEQASLKEQAQFPLRLMLAGMAVSR